MRRRGAITFLLGTAVLPVAAWAQPVKSARLGVLVTADPEPFLGLLRDGLRSYGYVEGKNLQIELRSAQGKPDLLPVLAAELVRGKVDVLVAWQTPAVQAAKQATREIPIVMSAGDPVGTGLVASLARPGGNITGVTGTTAVMAAKTIELIREMLPAAKRLAILANAADSFTRVFVEQIEQAGRAVALDIHTFPVRRVEEFDAAFAQMGKLKTDVVVVQPSLPRPPAISLALKYRLPSVSATPAFPGAGGLLSYSARAAEMYRGTAGYVDKILKGAKPADLPVQQASTFELVINLKTAKALGVTIPRVLLQRADKLIE
ncbi:MAG: ABC transporter substrate-binding protein [Burkholderiales bacterium]